jgi:anti-sigma-K factor RskA
MSSGDAGRDRFEDLAAVYALGALGDEERREFEGYLAEHPELQAEVEDLSEAARLLALAPTEYEPPPNLRRNLLERVGGEAGMPFADRRHRSRLGALLGPAGLGMAAAVLAILVGLVVWNLSLQDSNEELRADVRELQGEARQANAEEIRTYELQGSGAASGARGQVMTTGEGPAVLVAQDLPPAPEGQVYEAWVLHDGVPQPAGLFEPTGESAAATIEAPLEGADAVAVTLEPDEGSPMPTSDVLLTAPLV